MKCRACGRELPENSLFCCWCGKEQLKKARKRKADISVPKAVEVSPGNWYIRMRLNGESIAVYEPTEALCRARAVAIKAGLLDARKHSGTLTLGAAIDKYIADRSAALSPATIRGYSQIRRNRFKSVMDEPLISVTDWQPVVNAEAALCSAKTLKNAWGLVRTVLALNGVEPKPVSLPQVVRAERPWLDFRQIKEFLSAAEDQPGELAALLALHSLRRSELCAVTFADVDIKAKTIRVSGAAVYDDDNNLIRKATNKNTTSNRTVPVMIPRLLQLLPAAADPAEPVVKNAPHTVWEQINRICVRAGLPEVGVHGLRHSFASLAYHLGMSERETMELGGWSDAQTIHKIYLHLAQADRLQAANKMAEFYSGD